MAGVDLPVTPLRREIMVSEPVGFDTSAMPFTIDFSSSYYVHPEGRGLLFGCPDAEDRWGFDERRDPDCCSPSPNSSAPHPGPRRRRGQTRLGGTLRDDSRHNALIGQARELDGFTYACGFSGHGFLMGPAVGESSPTS